MKTGTNKFSALVKRVAAATMAAAMVLTSATLPTFAKTSDAGKTYTVPVVSLESGAPLPPVKKAFSKAFGDTIEINEKADGTKTAKIDLQHMVVDMSMMGSGSYECNIQTVTGAKVLATETRKLSPTFGKPEVIVDNEVPTQIELTLPEKDETGKYTIELTVDFMDQFFGGGQPYLTDVKLTLDEGKKSELIADYTKVDALLETIPADLSGYSAESVKALNDAKAAIVRDLNVAQQANVDEMAANLDAAIKGLTKANGIKFENNAIYEVEVTLWNASSDKPSMAASSVKQTAKIYVKDGVATMHIYTQPMTLGTITASLEELRVYDLDGKTYKNGVVEAKSADGKPVEFSFVLPHTNEFIKTEVNPHVAMMGNQFIKARLKVNYASMKKVGMIATEGEGTAQAKPTAKPATKPEMQNEIPHTADSSNVVLFAMMTMASCAGVVLLGKKRKAMKA